MATRPGQAAEHLRKLLGQQNVHLRQQGLTLLEDVFKQIRMRHASDLEYLRLQLQFATAEKEKWESQRRELERFVTVAETELEQHRWVQDHHLGGEDYLGGGGGGGGGFGFEAEQWDNPDDGATAWHPHHSHSHPHHHHHLANGESHHTPQPAASPSSSGNGAHHALSHSQQQQQQSLHHHSMLAPPPPSEDWMQPFSIQPDAWVGGGGGGGGGGGVVGGGVDAMQLEYLRYQQESQQQSSGLGAWNSGVGGDALENAGSRSGGVGGEVVEDVDWQPVRWEGSVASEDEELEGPSSSSNGGAAAAGGGELEGGGSAGGGRGWEDHGGKQQRGGGDSEAAGGVCFNCGSSGHMSRSCPKPTRDSCYQCGKTGHLAKDCKEGDGRGQICRDFLTGTCFRRNCRFRHYHS